MSTIQTPHGSARPRPPDARAGGATPAIRAYQEHVNDCMHCRTLPCSTARSLIAKADAESRRVDL